MTIKTILFSILHLMCTKVKIPISTNVNVFPKLTLSPDKPQPA